MHARTDWMHGLSKRILDYVFEPEQRRLEKWKRSLCLKAQALTGREDSYHHKGVILHDGRIGPAIRKAQLPPSLVQEADLLVDAIRQAKEDRAFASMAVNVAIRGCETPQDVRDALPKQLRLADEAMVLLPRTREEAWTVKGTVSEKAYDRLRDMIAVYEATRLVA